MLQHLHETVVLSVEFFPYIAIIWIFFSSFLLGDIRYAGTSALGALVFLIVLIEILYALKTAHHPIPFSILALVLVVAGIIYLVFARDAARENRRLRAEGIIP